MKKSELRQIIREEIQNEMFGLEKYGRGDEQREYDNEDRAKENAKELSTQSPDESFYVVEYSIMAGSRKKYKIEKIFRASSDDRKNRYEFMNGKVKTNYVINPYTKTPYTK